MNVWLINPFDPLPGDPEQEGRYASLVRHLADAGCDTTWWTSSFSHRFKKPVDQQAITAACKDIGVGVRFLESPAYGRNVGLARLKNHRRLASQFKANAKAEKTLPDVIVASAPPTSLADAAIGFAKARSIPSIVDVQDLWPETFQRILPKPLRPLGRFLLSPSQRRIARAYRNADAVCGVADAYCNRAVELGGDKQFVRTIPLGIDLDVFDAATQTSFEELTRPVDEMWLIYAGSLNVSYDSLTIIRAAKLIRERGTAGGKWRLFISGRGEQAEMAKQLIETHKLENVTLTGFMEFEQWAYLLSQCDVGFNASLPDALIYLPNKIFYYFAAGLAVVNTIPGQCSRIVSQGNCGMDYPAGDVEACAAVIEKMLADPQATRQMGQASRKLAETTYDRRLMMPKYVEFIKRVAEN